MKIFSAIFLTFLFAGLASACQCMIGGTAKDSAASPNIAILRLISVDKSGPPLRYQGEDPIRRANLRVERVFKGEMKAGGEPVFAQGSDSSCGWSFKESDIGTAFLFYLDARYSHAEVWSASICSHSARAEDAVADIRYLEKMAEVRGRTRISGRLVNGVNYQGGRTDRTPFAETTVRIRGQGREITLKTDKDGVYEIYGLPPGRYRIVPEKPDGKKFEVRKEDARKIELRAGDHAERSFFLNPI